MRFRDGQVGIEYMVVIGFTSAILVALIVIAFFYSAQVRDQIKTNQVDKAARKILDAAQSVYYAGEPSKTTIDLTFPKGIDNITVNPTEIIFVVSVSGAHITQAYTSRVNLSGSISSAEGLKHVKIESFGGYVRITG